MLDRISAWADAHILTSPELALVGFASATAVGAYALIQVVRGAVAASRSVSNAAGLRRAIRNAGPGFRILLTRSGGPGGARAGKFTKAALSDHLEQFSFGAPFQLVPAGRISGADLDAKVTVARKRLVRSGADMIVWSERVSGREGGYRIHGLSRGGGVNPADAEPFVLTFTGRRADWRAPLGQVLAYRLAKHLQPSLGRPEGFRPERVREITHVIDDLLRGETPLSEDARAALEDDFCAGALHVAEQGDDPVFIERVIELRRSRLAESDYRAGSLTQSQLDLGRAMLAKADRVFDPILVREAMQHLDLAIVKLRTDDMIARAQQATDAVTRGQKMLETRKRFSLNFAG